MKLGIFDSGIGGEAMAQSLQTAFPAAEIFAVNDREHMPYGDKTSTEIVQLTNMAVRPLLDADCDIIIIACNTATAVAIEWLRQQYPHQVFIGLEPMVKPAAELTKTGYAAILATPATLASQNYKNLKATFADEVVCIEPDCRKWAYMIEHNELEEHEIESVIETVIDQGADVIVLACTHYHWIREIIEQSAASRARIIDPSGAIIQRIRQLMTAGSPRPQTDHLDQHNL